MFFKDLEVPAESLIGEEGRGLYCVMDGMVAERILVSGSALVMENISLIRRLNMETSESFSTARLHRTRAYNSRSPKHTWNSVQRKHYCMRQQRKFDKKDPTAGADANMAKYLCSEAAYNAAEACMQTFGGYAAANEYHINRKWMQTRMMKIAPISSNLILSYVGQHVLKMPRSY